MIRHVYLPLFEGKNESKMAMDKFVKSVKTSMQQAYGNITIDVPDVPDWSIEQICNDHRIISKLMVTIDKWTETIKETVEKENLRQKESMSATGETEYWRARNATFNTLYQQLSMPPVKRILDIMQYNNQKSDNYSLDHFNSEWQKFQKEYA